MRYGAGPPPAAAWPHEGLDVEALHAGGWRPTPLREFVLKVHQQCNLACDYCYVYTMADQSWRSRPTTMSEPVWTAAAGRIAEHVARHGLADITVILHGGEPMLAGPAHLVSIARAVRDALPAGARARICMQTNGLLLTEAVLRTLLEHRIRVGVSMDGPPESNDRHRRYANGTGSSAAVMRALELLGRPRYRPIFGGLLCTIDRDADPVACYEALLAFDPPSIDFLLPHANWSAPPGPGTNGTTYADWLVRLFDRWYGAPSQETRVRLFEAIISLVLGGPGHSEQIGLSPVAMAVVETDGAIEQTDSLKSAYPGAAATGLSVLRDPFDAALAHPGVVARQIGRDALCQTCRDCPIHRICGGGHYTHRYRPGAGFRNPSVYCADLQQVIGHIRGRVRADLAALRREPTRPQPAGGRGP